MTGKELHDLWWREYQLKSYGHANPLGWDRLTPRIQGIWVAVAEKVPVSDDPERPVSLPDALSEADLILSALESIMLAQKAAAPSSYPPDCDCVLSLLTAAIDGRVVLIQGSRKP